MYISSTTIEGKEELQFKSQSATKKKEKEYKVIFVGEVGCSFVFALCLCKINPKI